MSDGRGQAAATPARPYPRPFEDVEQGLQSGAGAGDDGGGDAVLLAANLKGAGDENHELARVVVGASSEKTHNKVFTS